METVQKNQYKLVYFNHSNNGEINWFLSDLYHPGRNISHLIITQISFQMIRTVWILKQQESKCTFIKTEEYPSTKIERYKISTLHRNY